MADRQEGDRPGVRYGQDDRIATITLDRAPVNALSDRLLAEIDSALDEAERRSPAVVIIRSALRAFVAGADLRSIASGAGTTDGGRAMERMVREMHRVFDRLARLPAVTIAEIGGATMGGGLELALACDLRVVADDALLGLPELGLGLLPGAGGTQRLTRLCGAGTSSRLILTGDRIDGREAWRLGLAQWIGPPGEIGTMTTQIAERVARLPLAAIAHAKSCIYLAAVAGSAGDDAEIRSVVALVQLPDTKFRIDRFLAKSDTAPGRKPAAAEPPTVEAAPQEGLFWGIHQ